MKGISKEQSVKKIIQSVAERIMGTHGRCRIIRGGNGRVKLIGRERDCKCQQKKYRHSFLHVKAQKIKKGKVKEGGTLAGGISPETRCDAVCASGSAETMGRGSRGIMEIGRKRSKKL